MKFSFFLFRFLTIFCSIIVYSTTTAIFCRAEIRSIPKPIVTIYPTSPYFSKMVELETLLKNNEKETLCKELIALFSNEVRYKNKDDIERFKFTEWLCYFSAMLPTKDIETRLRGDYISQDLKYAYRLVTCKHFVAWIETNTDSVSVAKKMKVEPSKLLRLHADYSAECLYSLHKISVAIDVAFANIEAKLYQGFMSDEEAQKEEELDAKRHGWPTIVALKAHCAARFKQHLKPFAKKLVEAYPNNVDVVQKYVKMIGFRENFECALFLQRTIGRSEKTKKMFAGLPSQKELDKILLEEERKRLKKIMEKLTLQLPIEKQAEAKQKMRVAIEEMKKENRSNAAIGDRTDPFFEYIKKVKAE